MAGGANGTAEVNGIGAPEWQGRIAAPDRKVAAIGIRVARGVTMHGFALNCDCDLSWFDRIVPCGIRDAQVTTLSREAGRTVTVADVIPAVQRHLADALGAATWRATHGTHGLLAATTVPRRRAPRSPAPAARLSRPHSRQRP